MKKQATNKQITMGDLVDFTDSVIFPKVEEIVKASENRILKSNDNIVKELKRAREEQAAVHGNYTRIEKKVENNENYLEKADKKLTLGYDRA